MLTLRQLKKRKTGISGTDITKIMNISQYGNAVDVYEDKIDPEIIIKKPTLSQLMGNILEKYIIKSFKEDNPNLYLLKPTQYKRGKYNKQLLALPDSVIIYPDGSRGLFEAKTSRRSDWGSEGTDEVPFDYIWQTNLYMYVYCVKFTHLRVWLLNYGQQKDYYIERNQRIVELIIEKSSAFWNDNVLKRVAPPDTREKKTYNIIPDSSIVADDNIINILSKYHTSLEQLNILKDEVDNYKELVSDAMKNSHYLLDEFGQKLVTKSNYNISRWDTKALSEHKDLVERFKKTSTGTRITINGKINSF